MQKMVFNVCIYNVKYVCMYLFIENVKKNFKYPKLERCFLLNLNFCLLHFLISLSSNFILLEDKQKLKL